MMKGETKLIKERLKSIKQSNLLENDLLNENRKFEEEKIYKKEMNINHLKDV